MTDLAWCVPVCPPVFLLEFCGFRGALGFLVVDDPLEPWSLLVGDLLVFGVGSLSGGSGEPSLALSGMTSNFRLGEDMMVVFVSAFVPVLVGSDTDPELGPGLDS